MTLRDRIHHEIERQGLDVDVELVARRIYERVRKEDLYPLLLAQVRHDCRDIVRSLEAAYFRPLMQELRAPTPGLVEGDGRLLLRRGPQLLLQQKIKLNTRGDEVIFGEATVEQWRERRQMFAAQEISAHREVLRCDEAVQLIEEKGVTRLNDLASEEIAPDLVADIA